jgi:hypothetical protein
MQHPSGSEILSINDLSTFRFAKPDDTRRLEREQQELSWALDGRSQYDGERLFGDQLPERLQGGTAPDQDHIRTLMAKNTSTLESSRPPKDLTPIQQSKYAAMERDLRKDIAEGMLSTTQVNDPTEYHVEMELAWQHYKGAKAIAWMNVRQLLDPTNDSPFFTSIESLRPTTPPTVDLRKLRMNWDNIAFTDKAQRAEVAIDDTLYVQFLRLKALDWSDKGIMRELGLSRAGLEVAQAKLMAERQEQHEPEPDDEGDVGLEEVPEDEVPVPRETPVSPEPDEDPAEVEARAPVAPNGHLPAYYAVMPETRQRTVRDKASWLRQQLEQRHITVATLGRALGLSGKPLSAFSVTVSKGQAIAEETWHAIGMVLAHADEDKEWIKPYEPEGSWKRGRASAKEVAKSRTYGD